MTGRSAYDFRRWRHKLYNYQFAIASARARPSVDQRVDKATWVGIVHLPDDVSLRTSDYHGKELRLAYQNACRWWDLFEDITDSDTALWPLREFIISNYAECDASIYNALVGYYRQAGASLRFLLEAILAGLYFSASPERILDFEKHRAGDPQAGVPFMNEIRHELYAHREFRLFNAWLMRHDQPEFLQSRSPAGCIYALYDELTEFSHGRMAKVSAGGELTAFSNVDIWESNGPIFRQDQFLRWFDLFCAALFSCGALVRIFLKPADTPSVQYLKCLRAATQLHLSGAARGRVSQLIQYLNETVEA